MRQNKYNIKIDTNQAVLSIRWIPESVNTGSLISPTLSENLKGETFIKQKK